MMFYTDSKTFQNEFLTSESDNDILKTQYVIISQRIRKHDGSSKNIAIMNAMLYPPMTKLTDEDNKEEYFRELDNYKPTLATLILGSIEEKFNIMFICTKKESKLKYLKWLSEYIFHEFGYSVYKYQANVYKVIDEMVEEYKDEDKKVAKRCKKILKEKEKEEYNRNLMSAQGRERIMSEYKKMKKKELIKIAKKKGFYSKGMDKDDILSFLELCL